MVVMRRADETHMKNAMSLLVLLAGFCVGSTNVTAAEAETTRELNGTTIPYVYTNDRAYKVNFEAAGASYRYLTGSRPDKWWGPFPSQTIRVRENQYFTSWFEEGYGDYVTLLINFDESKLYDSAILRGEEVHFHSARIRLDYTTG